jgi:hypothetical protein
MEAAEKTDEARPSGYVTRKLQGALDRLRTALAGNHLRRLAQRIERIELLAEARHAFMPVIGRDVQEVVGRILDRLHDLRMRVPGAAHADAAHEVEKAVAVHIPYFGPASLRHDEGVVAREGGSDDSAVARQQCLGFGSWQRHADTR